MENNILTLSSTAYLFHWSASNYSYSHEYYTMKRKINKTIQENGLKSFQYILTSDNVPVIEIDGQQIEVTPHMIKTIYGNYPDCALINNKNNFNQVRFFENHKKELNLFSWESCSGKFTYYSHTFKSFSFEYFEGLQYFRMHFNGNRIDFISSYGKIFEESNGNYYELTNSQFLNRIQANSIKSRKLIQTLIQAIRNESII